MAVSPKRAAARESLPDDLRPIYDQLADDYQFASFQRTGMKFVNYPIIAALVVAGWRPAAIGVTVPDSGIEQPGSSPGS